MPALTALGRPGPLDQAFAMVTVTHAEMGAKSFGVAPGHAELWATLRTLTDAGMERLCGEAEALARRIANVEGLTLSLRYSDVFAHCDNAPAAVAWTSAALDAEGVPRGEAGQPMLASEDFGVFGRVAPSALLLLGAGESSPGLHSPDYDFPDALIGIGARVFLRILRDILGSSGRRARNFRSGVVGSRAIRRPARRNRTKDESRWRMGTAAFPRAWRSTTSS